MQEKNLAASVFHHSAVCERNLGDGNSIDAACAFGRFDSKFSEYSQNTEVLWPSARQFARLQCIAAICLQVAMSCDEFSSSLPNCFRLPRLIRWSSVRLCRLCGSIKSKIAGPQALRKRNRSTSVPKRNFLNPFLIDRVIPNCFSKSFIATPPLNQPNQTTLLNAVLSFSLRPTLPISTNRQTDPSHIRVCNSPQFRTNKMKCRYSFATSAICLRNLSTRHLCRRPFRLLNWGY